MTVAARSGRFTGSHLATNWTGVRSEAIRGSWIIHGSVSRPMSRALIRRWVESQDYECGVG